MYKCYLYNLPKKLDIFFITGENHYIHSQTISYEISRLLIF